MTRASTTWPRRASTTRQALGFKTASAEAKNATDYEANIQRLIDGGCNTIVTVGFLQGTRRRSKATLANTDIAFGQVDASWNSAGPDGQGRHR